MIGRRTFDSEINGKVLCIVRTFQPAGDQDHWARVSPICPGSFHFGSAEWVLPGEELVY